MTHAYLFVDDDQQLVEACAYLSTHTRIAIDTEFMSDKTYRKHIALVQLAAGKGVYLVDPLAINNWQPLIDLLQEPSVIKVFHACGEDIDLIWQWLKVVPAPIMDTQVAYAFCSTNISIGLQGLVQQLLDIHIDKQQSRSNWLQRPLTQEQKAYAANDVVHLLACASLLQTQLKTVGKWDWFGQDMHTLQQPPPAIRPDYLYLKIKNIHTLNARQLLRLQGLAVWRETIAQTKDLPRSFIIKDVDLISVALENPASMYAIASIKGVSQAAIRRYGSAIIQVLEQANQVPEEQGQHLCHTLVQPISKDEQPQFKQFKNCLQQVAKSHDILPQLLARKADLIALFETYRQGHEYVTPKAWQGFRKFFLDQPMREVFDSLRR